MSVPDHEIKKIYEKSIRLLDSSQTKLSHINRLLKKTVFELSSVISTDNHEITDALTELKQLSDCDIDMDVFEAKLDRLATINAAVSDRPGVVDIMIFNGIMMEFVNALSLPDNARKNQDAIRTALSKPINDDASWRRIINEMSAMINQSTSILQKEKEELNQFITKIVKQLSDIESYVQTTRTQSAENASDTVKFDDSVNASVADIGDTVMNTSDLGELKKEVQDQLTVIKKNVEQHKRAVELQEAKSSQSYTQIISELARTQQESEHLKEQLKQSNNQLLRDTLTGLPNRLAYNERIANEFHRWQRHKNPLCVALWDIDHFKSINDTYGHDVGDKVLKIVANLISSRVRKVDMFARFGGEEFILLMPDTPLENALDLNNSLRQKLQQSGFHYDGQACQVTASVGIAQYSSAQDTPDSVLKRADIALYESKGNGRNRCTIKRVDE